MPISEWDQAISAFFFLILAMEVGIDRIWRVETGKEAQIASKVIKSWGTKPINMEGDQAIK